jgi:hypothetical protein
MARKLRGGNAWMAIAISAWETAGVTARACPTSVPRTGRHANHASAAERRNPYGQPARQRDRTRSLRSGVTLPEPPLERPRGNGCEASTARESVLGTCAQRPTSVMHPRWPKASTSCLTTGPSLYTCSVQCAGLRPSHAWTPRLRKHAAVVPRAPDPSDCFKLSNQLGSHDVSLPFRSKELNISTASRRPSDSYIYRKQAGKAVFLDGTTPARLQASKSSFFVFGGSHSRSTASCGSNGTWANRSCGTSLEAAANPVVPCPDPRDPDPTGTIRRCYSF